MQHQSPQTEETEEWGDEGLRGAESRGEETGEGGGSGVEELWSPSAGDRPWGVLIPVCPGEVGLPGGAE